MRSNEGTLTHQNVSIKVPASIQRINIAKATTQTCSWTGPTKIQRALDPGLDETIQC